MIKLEHNIFENRGVVAFAAEASNEKDLKTLDLLCQSLTGLPNIEVGFINSSRLVFQVRGLDSSIFIKEEDKT